MKIVGQCGLELTGLDLEIVLSGKTELNGSMIIELLVNRMIRMERKMSLLYIGMVSSEMISIKSVGYGINVCLLIM